MRGQGFQLDEYPPSFVQHRFRLPIESRVWITAVWVTAVWTIAVWTIAVWITTGHLLAAVYYCCVLQDAFAMCIYSIFSNNVCLRQGAQAFNRIPQSKCVCLRAVGRTL